MEKQVILLGFHCETIMSWEEKDCYSIIIQLSLYCFVILSCLFFFVLNYNNSLKGLTFGLLKLTECVKIQNLVRGKVQNLVSGKYTEFSKSERYRI